MQNKVYDFDRIIDRKGTNCIKYDRSEIPSDALPLWIADMDFATADFIIDAIKERLDHPVFGYPITPASMFELIASWVKKLHSWEVSTEEMTFIPGIIKGIGMVIQTFCKAGDKVIIQPPVYHPFNAIPKNNGLEVVLNPLLPQYSEDGTLTGYKMNFEELEELIDENTKLLILSNPHNPAGLCWSKEDLCKLAEITYRKNVLVISDEIHCEMLYNGRKHIPYASVSKEAEQNSITFMSPSKTFNIAGIVASYTIVKNPEIREKFFKYLNANELDFPNIFSVAAMTAAYSKGESWRAQMLDYVKGNIDYVSNYIKENIPQIKCFVPDASFLLWLDFRALGMDQAELVKFLIEEAKLYFNDGSMYGDGGAGYMRMNAGHPRSVIVQAMEQLKAAIAKL